MTNYPVYIDHEALVHCFSIAKVKGLDDACKKIYVFGDKDCRPYMAITNGHCAIIYRLTCITREDIDFVYSYSEKMEFYAKQNKHKRITVSDNGDLLFFDGSIINPEDTTKYIDRIERSGWDGMLGKAKSICTSENCKPSALASTMTKKLYEHMFAGTEKDESIFIYGIGDELSPQVVRIPSKNNFIGLVMPMKNGEMIDSDNEEFFKKFFD